MWRWVFAAVTLFMGYQAFQSMSRGKQRTTRNKLFALAKQQLELAAKTVGAQVPALEASRVVHDTASDGRKIYYNPQWLTQAVGRYQGSKNCQVGLVMGLMAHQLAHHFYGHLADDGIHSADEVLKADDWSGYVLGRKGLPGPDFERIVDVLSGAGATPVIAREQRAESIRRGYHEGWRVRAA